MSNYNSSDPDYVTRAERRRLEQQEFDEMLDENSQTTRQNQSYYLPEPPSEPHHRHSPTTSYDQQQAETTYPPPLDQERVAQGRQNYQGQLRQYQPPQKIAPVSYRKQPYDDSVRNYTSVYPNQSMSAQPYYAGQETINPIQEKLTSVGKTAYALLTFFLGSWGIHKFYAGFIGKGLLYLILNLTVIFSPIVGLLCFCTFVKTLITTKDRNGQIYLDSTSKIINVRH